jgi:hypothetical protein
MARRIERFISRLTGGRKRLLRQLPKGAVGAEIGVWKGDFSEQILEIAQPKVLYLVDPWAFQPDFSDRMFGGTVAKSQADMDAIFEGTKARLSGHANVEYRRMTSDEYFAQLTEKLDWIYIDGNHFYDWVKRDIENALKAVKPGGFVCGDDYYWFVDGRYQVQEAVRDVLEGTDYRLRVVNEQFLIQV